MLSDRLWLSKASMHQFGNHNRQKKMREPGHGTSPGIVGRWVAAVPIVVGVAVIVLGLTVLVGWHAGWPRLIQLHPTFAPMKYNTALCFLCSGGALLAIGRKARRVGVLLGGIVTLVGLLTLAEYVFDADLGIDQLLFRTYIFTQTSHPGRMSPVAALVFSMVGVASISAATRYAKERKGIVTGLLSSLVIALSSMALLGYATGLTGTYGWGLLSRMALHTASGFLALGVALFILAWLEKSVAGDRSPRWLPISATLAAASATIVLWQALKAREQEQVKETAQVNAALVKNAVAARLVAEMDSLGRMVRSWEYTGQPLQEVWEADAFSHLENPIGYREIAWVDPELQVRWSVPQALGETELSKNIDAAGFRAALGLAREKREAWFSSPMKLESEDTALLAAVPIYREGRFEGWMAGIIGLKELLDAILEKELAARYAMSLSEGDDQFYLRAGETGVAGRAWEVELPIIVYGVDWRARIWPRTELLVAQRSHFTEAVLILGVLASTLIGTTVHLAQRALSRSQQLAVSNRELEHEVVERNRAEEELKGSEARFTSAFEHASIGMALVSPEGRWIKVNRALCRLMGYEAEELYGKTFQDITHPEDLELDLLQVRQMLAGDIPSYQMEKRYFHKDGHVVWVVLSVTLLRDAEGEPVHFVSQIQDITERKEAEAALNVMHTELLEASRRAGMAEVATSVLHNVGNVLNSVNIACSVAAGKIRTSRIGSVKKTADLLEENAGDLAAFVAEDPRGRKLPGFLRTLAGKLEEEQSEVLQELQGLGKNIDHIKQIVAMQQAYAKTACLAEAVNAADLVEDSLRMNADALMRHEVEVIREYDEVPRITVEKHKAVQVLVNLIRNAKQACDDAGTAAKKVTLRVANGSGSVRVSVTDNGVGIPPGNLTRIFAHGFTTKPNGHGFGLHGAALAAQEMGGSLTVRSDGEGAGATFILELPVTPPGNPVPKS
jgi:PAS domain S-box-containing protein